VIHPIPGADGNRLSRRAYEVSTVPEIHVNDGSDYLFVLPISHGRLRLCRGAETVHDGPVQPGMLRIVAPGERSAMAVRSTFESLMLRVPSATVRRAADELGARVPVPGTATWSPVRPPHPDLHQLGKSMVGALTATDRRRIMLVEGLSVALLALVLDQGPIDPVAARVRDLDDTQWSAAVEFADASLGSGLDIDTWAAAVGLPTHEFARRFRTRAGSPPYAWFLDRRVHRAGQLLLRSRDSIADIALASGFNSQSHFTDAFRRRTGVPPGRWRAQRSSDHRRRNHGIVDEIAGDTSPGSL